MKSPSINESGYPDNSYFIQEDLDDWLSKLSNLDVPVKLEMVYGANGLRWIACNERKELCIIY